MIHLKGRSGHPYVPQRETTVRGVGRVRGVGGVLTFEAEPEQRQKTKHGAAR